MKFLIDKRNICFVVCYNDDDSPRSPNPPVVTAPVKAVIFVKSGFGTVLHQSLETNELVLQNTNSFKRALFVKSFIGNGIGNQICLM